MNSNFIKRLNNLWRGVVNNTEWNMCKRLWNLEVKEICKKLIKTIRKLLNYKLRDSYEPIYNLESYIYDKTQKANEMRNRKVLK